MRFIANGPDVPEDLLIARDKGDVIFFCGAGVSQANAHLPNFERLGRDVIRILGSAQDSPARKLLEKALQMGRMAGVGGLLATDRVFGLLEREFEVADVRAAVAEAIRPPEGYGLDAHRTMLDLATSRAGVTRLVTTNFDLLFEECDPALPCSGPPRLPDPRSDREFRGVVHLHGRVDREYTRPHDDEFVVSSADFGRAYLSDGWATRFIQALLARFQIVFVGYTADDPPVQYLLEALNLSAGSRSRLFAFQEGDSGEAAALWEHRGVQAISFDSSNGFGPLWDTLTAWAERARNVDAWYASLIAKAIAGPAALDPHLRGQVARVLSTREGAHRISTAEQTLAADWLLVLDPKCRYEPPGRAEPYDDTTEMFDPFEALSLDFDALPEPTKPDDHFNRRKPPEDAWDAFAPNRFDQEDQAEVPSGRVRGDGADVLAGLLPRLASLGVWIQRVAHQPIAVWWAAGQARLHLHIQQHIEYTLRHHPDRFPKNIRRAWRILFAAWNDRRNDPDSVRYDIEAKAKQEGWTGSLVRELAGIYRPRLKVDGTFGIRHPLLWGEVVPDALFRADIDYPRPHEGMQIPDEQVPYAVSLFRQNLELAISLEREIAGNDYLHFETSRANDGQPELNDDSYGLTGPIIYFQKLMQRWAKLDQTSARAEVFAWSTVDQHVFARLRIWAASRQLLTPAEAADIFLGLPDIVFWGSQHKRDLLHSLRDRWNELSKDARLALEDRLRAGAYPWSAEVHGGVERAIAHDRLGRLHWLSRHGVTFSFDLEAEMAALKAAAPDWITRWGDEAADSRAPVVRSIATDERADPLLEVPIPQILAEAQSIGQYDFLEGVQREPFRGFASRRPARALAALTYVGRRGEAPRRPWSDFLHAEGRATDSLRMIRTIAARLERLPIERLRDIAYPVTEWMVGIAERLYGDAAEVLPSLWDRLVQALVLWDHDRRHRPDRSWAGDALNAPVGKLVDLLLKDPAKNNLEAGAGYPAHWTARIDQLLALPGDLRRQALVMISFQLAWLFAIDPTWTERQILLCADDPGDDGDAFWEGVFWSARMPSRELFLRLKSGLTVRATQPHLRSGHHSNNVIAGFLLAGWGGAADADPPDRLITDVEFREILIHTDDELRGQVIWNLERWSTAGNGL
jgi:SIR2-like domain